ncbi:DUF2272 domain-containing protein [Roseomonas sp. M0104]|uniref:DUF2272 domain-containing protein n=1 Tax=Teichococcus coralli TaxID=2545983 RepID=A0A845BL31_9PROT|nr:DUF2272 domain-containing protein [Pseudoroseomonas coralli]MXP65967.1 DUF2272 domain-containing protein [Pseudoroseomonas coralli]
MGLLLAALSCAAPPAGQDAARLGHEAPWRARIAGEALAEWQAWGRLTVDGWPEALAEPADPALFERVLAYWDSVPAEGPAVARRQRTTFDALMAGLAEGGGEAALPAISLWAYPAWSAAFISHVMARAGVPGFVFPPAIAHATYVDALLSQATWNSASAAFLPHDPGGYAPRPGDLLCADRSLVPLLHWQERLAEPGRFREMHCDVVVAAAPGRVQAVGGNVLDAVVLRRFPADAQGRLLPAPPDKPPFLVVFENRLDVPPAR